MYVCVSYYYAKAVKIHFDGFDDFWKPSHEPMDYSSGGFENPWVLQNHQKHSWSAHGILENFRLENLFEWNLYNRNTSVGFLNSHF